MTVSSVLDTHVCQLNCLVGQLEREPTNEGVLQSLFTSSVWTHLGKAFGLDGASNHRRVMEHVFAYVSRKLDLPYYVADIVSHRAQLLAAYEGRFFNPITAVRATNDLLQWLRARDALAFWEALGQAIGIDTPGPQHCCSMADAIERAGQLGPWMEVHKERLGELSRLDLRSKQLSFLPQEIGYLTALKELDLKYNNLLSLPKEIGNLSRLEKLILSNNKIIFLPEEIGNLKALHTLRINKNKLLELPEGIGNLSALQKLEASENQLSKLPESIVQLEGLRILSLNWNSLSAIPSTIDRLKSLTHLELFHNQLREIPSSIGNLSQLQFLLVHLNRLTTLPEEIGNLSALQYIYISGNPFTAFPTSLARLPAGCRILADFNPSLSAASVFSLQRAIRERGSHAPSLLGLSSARTSAKEINLKEMLMYWVHSFKAIEPGTASPHPLEPNFISFYQPLLAHEKHEALATFLSKLREKSHFSETQSIVKIGSFLESAAKSEAFREVLFKTCEEATGFCIDRIAWGFNHIDLGWQIHRMGGNGDASPVDLAQLLIGHRRLHLLERIAWERMDWLEKDGLDQIEIVLFYHIRLKGRLNLPLMVDNMAHIGEARHISFEMLNEDAERVLAMTTASEDIVACLLESEHWVEKMKEMHFAEFGAIHASNTERLMRVGNPDPNDNEGLIPSEYDQMIAMQAISQDYQQQTQSLLRALTESWVRDHRQDLH